MTRSFCTYFNKNYLSRGLALYDSLRAHHPDFELYVGCMDAEARGHLARLALPHLVVMGIDELEAHDPELRAVRPTRTLVEYYFTSTAAWLRYVFQRFPEVEQLTYVDADVWFFASSESAYAEMADASIAIVAHRFPPALRDRESRGLFNVGWLSFRRDEEGLAAVDWWRARCIEWCYDRMEGDRFADQKYLDSWPGRYERLVVLSHPGVNVAPWNLGGAPVRRVRGELTVDGRPLVCFHFHGLKHALGPLYESGLRAYGVRLDAELRRDVFAPYLEAVLRHEADLVRAGLSVGRARSLRSGQTRLMRAKERALKLVSVGRLLASGSYLVAPSPMKVVVVDTYYPRFLAEHYRNGNRAGLDYATQRRELLAASFGTADAYSTNLAKVGIDAEELIANCGPLQLAWAREHGHPLGRLPGRIAGLPLTSRVLAVAGAWPSIVVAQVRDLRPDVLYLQDLHLLPPAALAAMRPFVRLIVGQCGSAPPPRDRLAPLDLILTSFPHYVARFSAMGLRARYFRIGFDARVLSLIGAQAKRHACTFVGGISPAHRNNLAFLEHVARHADVDFYGYGVETLRAGSPIRRRHHGEVWGLPMYRALAAGHITLNRHGAIAEGFANNMRLFEATGVGTLLITDAKSNLGELFSVGREVLAYRTPEECVELIRHYAARPAEAAAIAAAGQARTLREHSYERRMAELREILDGRGG